MSEASETIIPQEQVDVKTQLQEQIDAWDSLGEDEKENYENQHDKLEADEAIENASSEAIAEHLRQHKLNKENSAYVVRGAELMCDQGTNKRQLDLSSCHGVYIRGHAGGMVGMNGIKKFACVCACLLFIIVMMPLIFLIEGDHFRRKTFDMLQSGDFTSVTNLSDREMETLQFIYERNKENIEWEYVDINADGKEEIIYRESDTEWTNRKRIIAIFSFVDRKCELVLLDTIDNTAYYFIADSKLVYYAFHSGIYGYELFCVCNINDNGEIETNMRLEAFDFSDVDSDYEGDDWWNQEDIQIDSKGMVYRITINENSSAEERIVQEKEYQEVFETNIGSYSFYGMDDVIAPLQEQKDV